MLHIHAQARQCMSTTCKAHTLDEFTQHRLGVLRKYADKVMNRISTPFMTEDEFVEVQARIMPEIKSQSGRVEFIVNITEATRKSIIKMLEKNKQFEAANIVRETKITPWL